MLGLAAPAIAVSNPPVRTWTETFGFTYTVPCTGELASVEGTLRIVSVDKRDGGYVLRLTWTRFHGTGYEVVDGDLVPTGTKWVYSGTSGSVLVVPRDDGTRLRFRSIVRLTSSGPTPNLAITLISVMDFNRETQQFEVRVEKETLICA